MYLDEYGWTMLIIGTLMACDTEEYNRCKCILFLEREGYTPVFPPIYLEKA